MFLAGPKILRRAGSFDTVRIWGRAVASRLANRPAPERWTLPCGSTVWVPRPPSSSVRSAKDRPPAAGYSSDWKPARSFSSTLHWRGGNAAL
jgi:hypothetical protein